MKDIIDYTIVELFELFFKARNIENNLNCEWKFSRDRLAVHAFDKDGSPAWYEVSSLASQALSWAYGNRSWFDIGGSNADR